VVHGGAILLRGPEAEIVRGHQRDAMIAPVGEALETAKAWVEACDRGNIEGALALCDPHVELVEAEALPGSVTATGIDDVRNYLERFETHWSEVSWEPIEFREGGEKVYLRARLRLMGRRSGIEVDREWSYVFTVRDGKLLRQDGFDSEAEGLRAAGLEDQPAE
jgi:ketosteroid isomerase-like protein